jgi:hypothetical protein
MKKLIILLLLISSMSFGQAPTVYEYQYRENRTPTGWQIVQTPGDVIFYEDRHTNTITIVSSNKKEVLYVKSTQLFVRQDSYLLTLIDDNYRESRIRLVIKDTSDTVELYFYSDRIEDRYYRLILKKCK